MIKKDLYEAMKLDLLLLEMEESIGQNKVSDNEELSDDLEGGRV
jgi:hypothetical protein